MLWLSYSRAIARSEETLRLRVDIALRRADRILRTADDTLHRLARDIRGLSLPQAAELLQRIVYFQPYFREAGLIDDNANLICTSLGPVSSPVPVPPDHKSDPTVPGMQIVGLVKTAVMPTESIIVGLPTTGRGEVNLLIDPATFIDLFAEIDLGPNGSISFQTTDGKVLASRGTAPSLKAGASGDTVRLDRRSQHFSLVVVATSSRLWALRDWRNDLAIILPIGLLCSGGLGFVVLRLARNRGGLVEDIRLALEHNEFEPHYQPTIEAATSRCVGAEVLIRWNHPERGYIRPDLFIAVAEESGLIEPITESLMRTVATEMAEMMRKHPDLHLGINLAPDQFNSRRILEEFPRIFTGATIAPDRILLEATERSLIDDDQGLPHQVMDGLRKLGAQIALDDFGTGYSSLSYIQKFRFDYIKIDASFVRRIGRDTVSSGLINAIIDLGRTLKVRLIAEGVENELQFQFLKQHGVQYVQGWLFGKAMPARQFRDFVARQNA